MFTKYKDAPTNIYEFSYGNIFFNPEDKPQQYNQHFFLENGNNKIIHRFIYY